MSAESDSNLIARFKKGDRSAFDVLVQRYLPRVAGVASRFLRDRHEAMDVAQEVFIEAYNILKTWREEGSLFSWLYRTALNISRHRLRRSRRVVLGSVPDNPQEQNPAPEEAAGRAELAGVVAEAVNGLSDRQREVFLLRHEMGMQLEEIAEQLEISVGAAKSHLHRAVQTLRDRLKAKRLL